jgi:hypothetical protein
MNEIKDYPLIDRGYQHYKGGTYIVITLANNTVTKEIDVVYYSREFGTVYTRPLKEWFDVIESTELYTIRRFELL